MGLFDFILNSKKLPKHDSEDRIEIEKLGYDFSAPNDELIIIIKNYLLLKTNVELFDIFKKIPHVEISWGTIESRKIEILKNGKKDINILQQWIQNSYKFGTNYNTITKTVENSKTFSEIYNYSKYLFNFIISYADTDYKVAEYFLNNFSSLKDYVEIENNFNKNWYYVENSLNKIKLLNIIENSWKNSKNIIEWKKTNLSLLTIYDKFGTKLLDLNPSEINEIGKNIFYLFKYFGVEIIDKNLNGDENSILIYNKQKEIRDFNSKYSVKTIMYSYSSVYNVVFNDLGKIVTSPFKVEFDREKANEQSAIFGSNFKFDCLIVQTFSLDYSTLEFKGSGYLFLDKDFKKIAGPFKRIEQIKKGVLFNKMKSILFKVTIESTEYIFDYMIINSKGEKKADNLKTIGSIRNDGLITIEKHNRKWGVIDEDGNAMASAKYNSEKEALASIGKK